MNNRCLIVTGATGFLGREVLPRLLDEYSKIFLLTRTGSLEDARRYYGNSEKIQYMEGDISHSEVFYDLNIMDEFRECHFDILHMAALYNLETSLGDNYINNVVGTQNLLRLADKITNIDRFFYTSTIAVSGDYKGIFKEGDFEKGQSFSNAYARTKYDAEAAFRNWKTKAQKIIFRPGVIVGHSETGYVDRIDGPYYLLDRLKKVNGHKYGGLLLKTLKVMPFPYDFNSSLPLIAVDEVARFMEMAIKNPAEGELACYHVTGDEKGIRVKDFIKDAFEIFGLNLTTLPISRHLAMDHLARYFGLPKEALDYLFSHCHYDQGDLRSRYPEFSFKRYNSYKMTIMDKFVQGGGASEVHHVPVSQALQVQL